MSCRPEWQVTSEPQASPMAGCRGKLLVIFSLVLLTFLLTTFTWVLTRVRKPDALAWSLLAMFYVVIGVLVSVNSAVLKYNLYGRPLNILPELVVVFHRGLCGDRSCPRSETRPGIAASNRPQRNLEEVHASSLWALCLRL